VTWTEYVICRDDGAWSWSVVNGEWTCDECGKAMTATEIKGYHKQLDVQA
jgi:hypothetical protein